MWKSSKDYKLNIFTALKWKPEFSGGQRSWGFFKQCKKSLYKSFAGAQMMYKLRLNLKLIYKKLPLVPLLYQLVNCIENSQL